jgi:hypothetical protein
MGKFHKINKGSIVVFLLVLVACFCFTNQNFVKADVGNYIAINYSTIETVQLPVKVNQYNDFDYPVGGFTFLLFNATIENHGYSNFSTSPNLFNVIANNTRYSFDYDTYVLDHDFYSYNQYSSWSTVDVKNGETFTGTMVFVIPVGNKAILGYSGTDNQSHSYNIIWNYVIPPPTPTPSPTLIASLTPTPTYASQEPTQEPTSTPISGDSPTGSFWLIANTIALIVVAVLLAVIIILLFFMRQRKQEKTR